MNKKHVFHLVFAVLVFFVFRSWFAPGLLTAGDFWPYSRALYDNFSIIQYAWNATQGNGFGANAVPFLWIFANLGISIQLFGKLLGLDWQIVQRVAYLYPFLIITTIAPILLFRNLFPGKKFYLLASAIYLFNSYIIMIIAGGQVIGIGMAYALLPIVMLRFYKLIKKMALRNSILFGVIFALQLLFDIRIFYISAVALFIFTLFMLMGSIKKILLNVVITSIIIIFTLHAFWLLPLSLQPFNPIEELGGAYSTTSAVEFFSFATFENSISLLHPNYPENLFGKVGFMKPEFLMFPILAFSGLLFLKRKKLHEIKLVLSFTTIGLVGAFLAKGAQEPFGGIYLFLFEHFPGMQMFRDPTKFYILVALSYSVLIPYSIESIYNFIKNKKLIFSRYAFLFVIFVVIAFTAILRDVFLGNIPGLFHPIQKPPEYVQLEKLIFDDSEFYRTLWVPTPQRFSYYSQNHPSVSFFDLFKTRDYASISAVFQRQNTEKLLQDLSIKYVIIPYDSEGEIYLDDRKYSDKIYKKTLRDVSKVPYLARVPGYQQIGVFQVKEPRGHFWNLRTENTILNTTRNPTNFTLEIQDSLEGDRVIFTENFHPGWVLKIDDLEIPTQRYENNFNSFTLPKGGNYKATVFYTPQSLVYTGSIITLLSIILIIGILIQLKKK